MSLHIEYVIVDLFHMNSFTRASTNLTMLSVSANGDPHFFFSLSPLAFLSLVKYIQQQHTIIKHAYAGHKLVLPSYRQSNFFSFSFLSLLLLTTIKNICCRQLFFILSIDMPTKIYSDWSRPYKHNQELFISEPTDGKKEIFLCQIFYFEFFSLKVKLPIKKLPEINEKSSKSFEHHHHRPLERQNETTTAIPSPPLIRPLKSSLEKMQCDFDDNNDSSTSTTNRSIHLPVEKQRGLSEVIRKRNSRFKVEDYKRSFQKSNTIDETLSPDYQRPLPTSKSDYTLSNNQTTNSNISPRQKRLNKTKSVDMSMEYDKISMNSEQENSNEYVYIVYSY